MNSLVFIQYNNCNQYVDNFIYSLLYRTSDDNKYVIICGYFTSLWMSAYLTQTLNIYTFSTVRTPLPLLYSQIIVYIEVPSSIPKNVFVTFYSTILYHNYGILVWDWRTRHLDKLFTFYHGRTVNMLHI